MRTAVLRNATTLVEAVETALQGLASSRSGDLAPPAAILWTDATGEWKPLIPFLLRRLPQLLVLGPFDPARRSGPAIWVKCAIARVLAEPRIPDGEAPIIYLPEVSRQTLRAAADCPRLLQPLVELQYRGTVWTQRNGKDWTVEAFLVSDDALGLEVARDMRTREAMLGALVKLAETPLTELRVRTLDAEDFDRLFIGDPARELLRWMDDPALAREAWTEDTWRAFRSRAKSIYGFDPEKDGEIVAGEKLGRRAEAPWKDLWERYAEAPGIYRKIPDLLVRSKPSNELVFPEDRETWPDENRSAEANLRAALIRVRDLAPGEAREEIRALESEHGMRRHWVWARLGQSPLALALEHLAVLAERTATPLGGDSPDEMARVYAEGGFLADDGTLRASANAASAEDRRAVAAAIRAMYAPWLRDACELFQERVARAPLPTRDDAAEVKANPGESILFVDGLRFDLARRLVAALEERSLSITERLRWAAQPTVTPTAKPAISPVAGALAGDDLRETFVPASRDSGQPLTPDRFRRLLEEAGYDFLPETDCGDPAASSRAWTEIGNVDQRGHDLGEDLPRHLDDILDRVVERITGLLDAGWAGVHVVTDHGWLFLPGGLPKCDLPKYLVETRWARCALVKGESRVEVRQFPWHWNPGLEYAAAPGSSAFTAGCIYAHGGVSLQECLVLDLYVSRGTTVAAPGLSVKEARWVRLRCRVLVGPPTAGVRVDIRRSIADPASSIVEESKTTNQDGRASVLVEDEDLAGEAAVIVLADASGRVLATRPTVVGGGQ